MPNPTAITRVYPADNGWILKHRNYGSSAEVIARLIRFYEHSKTQLSEAGLE